jgi:hypothetical protein
MQLFIVVRCDQSSANEPPVSASEFLMAMIFLTCEYLLHYGSPRASEITARVKALFLQSVIVHLLYHPVFVRFRHSTG